MTLNSIDWDQVVSDNPDWIFVKGSQLAGSQYHFYMENQTAVAFPVEGGKIKVVASAQSPAMVQSKVAQVCQVPANYVIVEVNMNFKLVHFKIILVGSSCIYRHLV